MLKNTDVSKKVLTSAKLFLYQNVHNIMGYHHGMFRDSSICQSGYLRGAQLTPQKPGMNRVKSAA